MNKPVCLTLGLLFSCYTGITQSSFGVKAGLNLANQDKTIAVPQVPTGTQQTRPFTGYQLGLFYKTKPHNHFLLGVETNFSVIGSSMTLTTGYGQSHDTHDKLGYIEIPVTLQYSIGKVYVGAGPGIGLKLFSKLKNFQNSTYDINYYQTFDAAVNLLAGYRVSSKIDANIRYSHGLVNVLKDPGYASVRNRFFNFSLLYALK